MGPDTTRTNKKRQEIDGIYKYQGIYINKGGYIKFHFGAKSDGILLLININHSVAFEDNTPNHRVTPVRRLRLHNPRGQRNCTSRLIYLSRDYYLLHRLRNIEWEQILPPSTVSIKEYEDIDYLLMKARR